MTTFTTEDRLHAGEYPLTDEQIKDIWNNFERTNNIPIIDFARAIEQAHGITE